MRKSLQRTSGEQKSPAQDLLEERLARQSTNDTDTALVWLAPVDSPAEQAGPDRAAPLGHRVPRPPFSRPSQPAERRAPRPESPADLWPQDDGCLDHRELCALDLTPLG
jgi:hypothetical protein